MAGSLFSSPPDIEDTSDHRGEESGIDSTQKLDLNLCSEDTRRQTS